MTRLDFLNAYADYIPPELVDRAIEDLEKMDTKKWLDTYGHDLRTYGGSGWDDIDVVKSAKDLPTRLREAFGSMGFDPEENYKLDVKATKFDDVPDKDFDEGLAKMKEYYDRYIAEREEGFRKKQRQKEAEQSINPFWSEYSRARYVDDPDASMWGEQGSFNPYSTEGQNEIADNLLGLSGAVGDLMPSAIGSTVVGPSVRALRDVLNYSRGTYAPETKMDIAKSFLGDVAANAGVNYLPTAIINRGTQMTGNVGKVMKWVDAPLEVAKNDATGKLLSESLKQVKNARDVEKLNFLAYKKLVSHLPDSEVKTILSKQIAEQEAKAAKEAGYIDNALVRNLDARFPTKVSVDELSQAIDPEIIEANKKIFADPKSYESVREDLIRKLSKRDPNESLKNSSIIGGNDKPLLRYVDARLVEPELTGGQKLFKKAYVGAQDVAPGLVRALTTPNRKVVKPEDRELIEEIKRQNERFWKAGFEPRRVDGDPLWEAYSEWEAVHKKEK